MGFRLSFNLFTGQEETEEKVQEEPVNSVSQALSTALLSLSVNVVFEFDEPIAEISDFFHDTKAIADAIYSRNPLFSCIMKKDDWGVLRWQKTTLNIDDHISIAEFPPGEESYDPWLDDYISKLSLTPFDQSRPLWEVHILNYKTSKAGATMVIKVHHSLGDGISLMSTLFSFVRRVDNPDLPPTFPTAKPAIRSTTSTSELCIATKFLHRLWHIMLIGWYTMVDVISSSLRAAGWIEDSQFPFRRPPGVENMPIALSSATFPLEDIKEIKNSAGWTVNDVVTGIIFYGIQRYMQISLSAVGEHISKQDAYEKRFEPPKDEVIKQMRNSRVTALCSINLRALAGIQNIEEMLKPEAQAAWGNRVGLLPLRVPIMGKGENPMEFVKMAKRMMDRHKMSLGVFIYARLLGYVTRLKGPKARSTCLYNTIANTAIGITNMIGPMEKVAIIGCPVKSFSFFISGVPRALGVCVLSYAGAVVLQVKAQKAYVDAHMLSECFTDAFEEIQKVISKEKRE